jgi:predicted nuclease with TOPRIM domain
VIQVATKEELEGKLLELKSDYVRIQSDLDKLEYVKGRVSSAQEQLVRLEKEIAEVRQQLEELED